MAVVLCVFTVLEALVGCGVDNTQLFNDHTPVWRLSDEIFGDDFESCMDKTTKELEDDFRSFSELTQAQGQNRLLPSCKRKIKAVVQ